MTDIISRLPKLETFKMDLNEMSFDAAISQNRIQELTVTIERVNLSHEAFKIVPRDCLTRLAILRTPQGLEHGLLRDIICSSPRLSHLQLGCLGRQASELIGLVRDARKTTFHGGPGLLTFELMDEKLTPFDTLGDSDDYEHHIYCIVSFSEDSDSFEMRSWVRLMNGMFPHRDEPIQNFLRRYGWSIVYLDEGYSNMDTIIAATENDITRREESRIESFVLNADKLTTGSFEGPKAIERHAPKFKELGLYITVESSAQLGLAQQLLQEHVSTLFRMQLAVLKEYLSRIITTCPARREYPKLVSFELYFIVGSRCPSDCLSWIVAMISPPPRAASLSSTSLDLQTVVHCRSGAEDSWTALRKIALCNINFQPEEWKLVIEAIDFDELQHFDLRGSNFSQQQFRLLMDRIPDNRIPLKTLGISSSLAKNAQVVSMVAELQKKAPLVTVIKA
ncbi:hypothetical protein B0O80DRAFT_464999 [Mortierella sp. GBAus27b]|nr:hypothetical protein B0O80DRAFT_464999 [Mortierella sp. GBAus27b]